MRTMRTRGQMFSKMYICMCVCVCIYMKKMLSALSAVRGVFE